MKQGTLYLVPVPIGNPGDLTPRAAEVLQSVDFILCEDTRNAGLNLAGLPGHAPFLSYHEHNEQKRNPEIVDRLKKGESFALISDAGMPVISDPGETLVAACQDAGLQVTALPGPNAALTALVGSGLPADRFAFEGFLGKRDKELRDRLKDLLREPRTLLFYEAPHRLTRLLDALIREGYGERRLCLARELTKTHEEYERGTVAELTKLYATKKPRGEYVVVLEGLDAFAARTGETSLLYPMTELEVKKALEEGLRAGKKLKTLTRELEHQSPLSKNELYDLGVALGRREEEM